jgi:hypothetical protein
LQKALQGSTRAAFSAVGLSRQHLLLLLLLLHLLLLQANLLQANLLAGRLRTKLLLLALRWKFGVSSSSTLPKSGNDFFQAPSILSKSYLGFLQHTAHSHTSALTCCCCHRLLDGLIQQPKRLHQIIL